MARLSGIPEWAATIRLAAPGDGPQLGALLDRFNREFDSETPGADAFGTRLSELLAHVPTGLDGHGTFALLGGEGPDGMAIVRLRPSLYSAALEAYLAELYVVPERRGEGLGRALLRAAMAAAHNRGADRIELGTSETDQAARGLYASEGFINTEDGPEGPLMYVYERMLP